MKPFSGRPLLVAALLLASCGGSSSETDKTAPFVGTWTVTSGTLNATCSALPMPINQKLDGGQQTITKTADGALSMSILPGCNIILDVSNNAASLRATTPPQSCMFMFNGLMVMGTFTAVTFTVTGETAMFNYAGTGVLAGAISCPVSGVGMSMKSAPSEGGAPSPDAGSTDGP